MSNKGSQIFKPTKSRHRCYSSMNYQEYQDFFGTPPKMPQAPNAKFYFLYCRPQEDPLDIPFLSLENQTTQQSQRPKLNNEYRIKYLIQAIPEVQSSQANSIGLQSPINKLDFLKFGSQNRMITQMSDSIELVSVKRQRSRMRSYSQSSPFIPKLRIIDFLNESNNQAKKRVKIQ